MMETLANITAVAIGNRAVLIEGEPGSGKSSLALALIDRGAILIGDDAITFELRNGHPLASPPPNTAGLLEIRNVGIIELPITSAPLALVLQLTDTAPRFPLDKRHRYLCNAAIPLLDFHSGDANQAIRAEFALEKHGLAIS